MMVGSNAGRNNIPILARAPTDAVKNWPRSDLVNLPVGFNPRWEFRRDA